MTRLGRGIVKLHINIHFPKIATEVPQNPIAKFFSMKSIMCLQIFHKPVGIFNEESTLLNSE